MTHPKLIFKRMQFPTIHLHTPRSRNELIKSYKFGHYRSFLEVNKNTFFAKAYNLIMEYQNEIRPKCLLEDISSFLKSPITPPKVQNWRSYALLKLDFFCQIVKSQLSPKHQILPNGPIIFHLFWVCIISHVL